MSMEVRKAFGRRVRALRLERSYSLRRFALVIGIDKSFLVDIEYGRKAPTLDTIERIAGGLDVTMAYLMFGVDSAEERLEYDGAAGPGSGPEARCGLRPSGARRR